MIIESIVTTMDQKGSINFAPMGVEWREQEIVIKPYKETTTYPNLKATGVAVVNLTDNVLLLARGAISSPQFPWQPAERIAGAVLEDVCSWSEVEVFEVDDREGRQRTRADRAGQLERESVGTNLQDLAGTLQVTRHRSQQVCLAAASRAVDQEWRGIAAGMADNARCQLERRLVRRAGDEAHERLAGSQRLVGEGHHG